MPAAIAPCLSTKAGIPTTATSHPDNPVPEEPHNLPHITVPSIPSISQDFHSSVSNHSVSALSESDADTAETPTTEHSDDGDIDNESTLKKPRATRRRASTVLISESSEDVRKILGNIGAGGTQLVEKVCCGGGCCLSQPLSGPDEVILNPIQTPDNPAYRSLNLKVRALALDSTLNNVVPLPEKTVSFGTVSADLVDVKLGPKDHPPQFVQPHPPYDVFRAPLHHARELTKPGAEKRTYHFDIDVTDYPVEGGDVDFVVGGAIGVCPQNSEEAVDSVLNCLGVPKPIRDKKIMVRTTNGRWPTIWGDEKARELITSLPQNSDCPWPWQPQSAHPPRPHPYPCCCRRRKPVRQAH